MYYLFCELSGNHRDLHVLTHPFPTRLSSDLTGSSWRPRSGSMVNHRALTSAMIDSRDCLAAKRRAETEVMLPAGPKVALTGGADFNEDRKSTRLNSSH